MTSASVPVLNDTSREAPISVVRNKDAPAAAAVVKETVIGRPPAGLVLSEHASVPHTATTAKLDNALNFMGPNLLKDMRVNRSLRRS
jgi:hypothetical protein